MIGNICFSVRYVTITATVKYSCKLQCDDNLYILLPLSTGITYVVYISECVACRHAGCWLAGCSFQSLTFVCIYRAGGGPHIEAQYRQAPQLTRNQQFQAELLSGAMWFWILWHCWHDPDAVLVSWENVNCQVPEWVDFRHVFWLPNLVWPAVSLPLLLLHFRLFHLSRSHYTLCTLSFCWTQSGCHVKWKLSSFLLRVTFHGLMPLSGQMKNLGYLQMMKSEV